MRSVECPDAAAVRASARAALVDFVPEDPADFAREGLADFDLRPQVSAQAQADSGQVLDFAPLAGVRALGDSHHFLPQTAHSGRDDLFLSGAILSASITRLDFAAFIIVLLSLTAVSDASRPSSAPDYFGARRSIPTTTVTIIPITMERRRRNRLS